MKDLGGRSLVSIRGRQDRKMVEDGGYVQTTQGIVVTAVPAPIEEETSPSQGVYSFAYTITIENGSSQTVQLLERHWIIKSAEIQIGEVVGPGVVGLQPVLKPGETFTYTSGAVVHDPVGSMQGTYTFKGEDGETFLVDIPRFSLCYEQQLN